MKKCCTSTLIKGTLAGGVALFVIFMSSKILMPWNKPLMSSLTNEGILGLTMAKAFVLCLVGGAGLTMILKKVVNGCPVFTSVIVAALVALFSNVPNMIFYHAPFAFTRQSMGELFLAFLLAGFTISRLVLKSGSCKPGCCAPEGDKKAGCH